MVASPVFAAYTAKINDSSAASIACPFPHNIRYAFGLQPSRYTQAQYAAAVSQFYTTWCSTFVTASGSNYRVWWPDGTTAYETVSEGIGYGMLIAVQMADKTLFDGLNGYYQANWETAHGGTYHLMEWQCPGPTANNNCSGNAATDADQDCALALYMAAYQWNSTAYSTEANTVAADILSSCMVGSRVTGGDSNTGVIYPDYCAPGWYRCFASKTGNAGWTNVANWVYNTLCPALESQWTYGYVPNEINNDGTFHSPIALGSEGANNHGYDASRWGWRMGTDYLWNGSNQGPISMFAHTMQAGVTANGYLNYVQEYFDATDGKTATKAGTDGSTSPCSHLQIGPALVGCMAGLPNNPVNQAFVDDTYDELDRRLMANTGCVTLEYFQDTLGLMCLMVGTGNFPNMACSGCASSAPAATPTPMPCFMLSDLEDDTLINATNGYWFTFSYASLNNTPVNPTPTRALVSSASYILQSPGAAGTNWAAAVTGFWMDNGLATPATYGGFAIATQLNPPWNNLMNLTVGSAGPCSLVDMTFYTKATAPMTVRVNFYNPAIDPSNGGNANQFGYTIPVTTSWQAVTITYNEIMCQDWAGTGVCTGGITGGGSLIRSQALTNVTSIQWDTAGNPATVGYWVDQVCMHFAKISNGYYTPVVINTATPSAVAGTPTGTPTSSATRTSTATPSSTPTNTVTRTATFTATNTIANTATSTTTLTPTGTPTGTPTSSATRTPTATTTNSPTNTVASTSTNSATSTASRTSTLTPTATPTSTLANTATNTTTSTVTNTLTSTTTSSATRTATFTMTATATSTLANTATNTASPSPSFTTTSTASRTPTATATSTTTSTLTATVTNTFTITDTFTPSPTGQASATNTPSSTASGTPTLTATRTTTQTPTLSTTQTPTNTLGNTATATATSTATNTLATTATNTATSTTSSTATKTSTSSVTATPTSTLADTATATTTKTASSTPSFTTTSTLTSTPTNTFVFTATPSFTPSSTPTEVTVVATQGTNPPGNSTQPAGTSGLLVQQVVLTNPSSSVVNVTAVTLTLAVGGGGNSTDITGVTLWENGTAITTTTFSGNTAVYLINEPLGPSASATFTVTADFGTNAIGTYTFSVAGMGGNNGQPVGFSNMPVAGAMITIAQFTSTPTSTPTVTPTLTPIATPSSSPTETTTSTPMGTSTFTASPTSSITSTPQPNTTPIVFPNPSTGGPVMVAASFAEPVNQVDVQIFTTAFRKVQDNTVNPGTAASNWRILIQMQDSWGNPLASGLYYVVITADGHQRSVVKLLLLR